VCLGSAFDIGGSDPTGGTQTDDAYCAHRGEGGWTIEWVAQPRGAPLPPQSPIAGASVRWITDDGARMIWTSDIKGIVPERPPARSDGFEGYLRAGGQTQWVTPVSPLVEDERHPLAASKDLSHVVYLEDITPPEIWWERVYVLWEWVEGSGARRVTVTEAGAPATGTANLDGATSPFGSGMWALPTTVSDDGSRIFFESNDALAPGDAATTDVYVREDGTTTRLLSERRGPASTEAASFAGASEDGEVAYIRTTGQLTADAKVGTAVYRYTLATDSLELVEDDIGSTLAVSADGSSIVFTGTNVLDPADGESLYINRGGTTTRIAPLPFGNTGAHLVAATNHTQRALRMTADGSVVVFRGSTPDPGLPAVHRWEADEGLTTVSVDQDGNAVAAGFGNLGFTVANIDINAGRGMTDDGETVFFDTEEALSARDVNGARDVYAWNDGSVRLITPGADPDGDARYLDNSADGSTVFFTTYEQVLPRLDDNTARDLYAARVGGGFPEPPPVTIGDPPPPQPPADAPPPTAPPSQGDGDQAHDPRPEVSAATPNAAARRAAARTGRLPLRIALTGGGKVTVRATAVVGGKRRTVATASRTVRRAGRTPVRLELRLSQAARRELRRRGRLSLRIAVNGARVLDDVQMTVVLRRSTGGR
jgi:hypothetical protein